MGGKRWFLLSSVVVREGGEGKVPRRRPSSARRKKKSGCSCLAIADEYSRVLLKRRKKTAPEISMKAFCRGREKRRGVEAYLRGAGKRGGGEAREWRGCSLFYQIGGGGTMDRRGILGAVVEEKGKEEGRVGGRLSGLSFAR